MPFTSRTEIPEKDRADLDNILKMFPYIWAFKSRVVFALLFLIIAKLATVAVPILLKEIVDSLNSEKTLLILPLGLLIAYGSLRLTTAFFNELREREYYTSKGEKKRHAKAAAIRRAKKERKKRLDELGY